MLVFLLAAALAQPAASEAPPAAMDCAAVRVILATGLGPWVDPQDRRFPARAGRYAIMLSRTEAAAVLMLVFRR